MAKVKSSWKIDKQQNLGRLKVKNWQLSLCQVWDCVLNEQRNHIFVDKILEQLKYLKKSSVCGAFEMLFDDFRGYEGESEINEKNPQILNLIG